VLRPDDAPPLTRGVLLRAAGLVVAVGLGALAAWLIVTSTTQKNLELGVLAGLWAALLGAFAMFGARRRPVAEPVAEPVAAEPAGSTVELRKSQLELERVAEAQARRAHEQRLEQLLRDEIRNAVARELASVRAELVELRSELVEKVGGQLRLERIETTRVIGSDLEALQHELRELKAAQEAEATPLPRSRLTDTAPVRQIVETARVRPVSRQSAEVAADVQPARAGDVQPARAADVDVRSDEPASAAAGAQSPEAPRPAPAQPAEGFADLPRIRPFTDFELDPVGEPNPYTGRRRRVEDNEAAYGRHARDAEPAGRRHRREDGEEDDLLARLLARHGQH
jgi:hypothetical protein